MTFTYSSRSRKERTKENIVVYKNPENPKPPAEGPTVGLLPLIWIPNFGIVSDNLINQRIKVGSKLLDKKTD